MQAHPSFALWFQPELPFLYLSLWKHSTCIILAAGSCHLSSWDSWTTATISLPKVQCSLSCGGQSKSNSFLRQGRGICTCTHILLSSWTGLTPTLLKSVGVSVKLEVGMWNGLMWICDEKAGWLGLFYRKENSRKKKRNVLHAPIDQEREAE